MEKAADVSVLVAGENDERLVVSFVSKRIEGHREAALGCSLPSCLGDAFELSEGGVVKGGEVVEFGAVAGLLQPGDGLAHLPYRAAFERERIGVDDRLVSEVERAQAEFLEAPAQRLANADRRDREAMVFGERAELVQERP